ncbi:MAG: phage tail protein [Oscillospiraceae bacterium]|jgi:phage-related protein|nr:phage tail protein [Oscillospiraceae bacterium]
MSDIGIKLALDGEKEFKRSLTEINSAFKVLSSEMAVVSSEFDKNDKSVQAAAARNGVLNKEIDAQKDKISMLKDALNNASESFGESDKRTQAWATKLNYAQADLNKMEQELDENNAVLELNGENLNENSQNLDEFGKSADDAGQKALSLGDIIKANLITEAIISGLKALGSAISAIPGYFSESIKAAASYGDNILTMSQQTGISTQKLQELSAISELVDVDLDTMTKSMAKNIKSMSSAQSGSGAVSEAYKKLGVAITDSNGNLKDSEEVYWASIDALSKISNETERDALAMQLFGKSAQELNPLIAQGSAGIAEMTQYAYQIGAVLSEDVLTSLGAMDDQFQIFGKTMESTKNLVGATFAPTVTALVSGANQITGSFNGIIAAVLNGGDIQTAIDFFVSQIQSVIPRILEIIPQFLEVASNLINALVQGVSEAAPLLLNAVVLLLPQIVETLMGGINQLIPVAMQIIMVLVQGIISALPQLVEGAVQMIGALVKGISQALPTLIPAVVTVVMTIVQALIDNIDLLLEAGIEFLTALIDAIPPTITALLENLPKIISTIIQAVINAIPLLLDGAIKLFMAIVEAIPKIVVSLIENLPKIITSIITTLTKPENISLLLRSAVKLFMALISAIPTIVVELAKSLPQIITAIVKGIGTGFTAIVDAGKNLIKGLWQGISDMTNWIKDKIKGFGESVVNGLKNFFGIHSPSSLFRDKIGKNLALGLGEGFSEEMSKISNDMKNAVPTDFDVSLNPNLSQADYSSSVNYESQALATSDLMISAFQKALSGMAFKVDSDKIGELVISKVERVVYA